VFVCWFFKHGTFIKILILLPFRLNLSAEQKVAYYGQLKYFCTYQNLSKSEKTDRITVLIVSMVENELLGTCLLPRYLPHKIFQRPIYLLNLNKEARSSSMTGYSTNCQIIKIRLKICQLCLFCRAVCT
jgi:hypothetical protein